jgi:hypothetical protein
MRQLIIASSTFGSLVVFALVVDLFDAAFMFLLFGVLPGHDKQLSANQMLSIYSGATVLIVGYSLRNHFATAAKFISLNFPRRSSAS